MSEQIRLVVAISNGDANAAAESLALVYHELCRLARLRMGQERVRTHAASNGPGTLLGATALGTNYTQADYDLWRPASAEMSAAP
jgi:hypothetical protein